VGQKYKVEDGMTNEVGIPLAKSLQIWAYFFKNYIEAVFGTLIAQVEKRTGKKRPHDAIKIPGEGGLLDKAIRIDMQLIRVS
jgi:hypothetical protein